MPVVEFFKEILLSYRLIFGQDERSYKAFSKEALDWEEGRGRSSWETRWDCDPMLHILCGKSVKSDEARTVYAEIEADEPMNCYNPDTEFLFFGKRLLELQNFTEYHQPESMRALLSDRRDLAAWFNPWITKVSFISVGIYFRLR